MDFELGYYKRWAEVRRKAGLWGMVLTVTSAFWPLLLTVMALLEREAPGGDLISAMAIFGFMLGGFSMFWVWGHETKGLVAEIEKLRAMRQHGNEA